MTVITEDMLRNKRLKKELEDGTDFVFPVGSFLTQAAKSYTYASIGLIAASLQQTHCFLRLIQ